MHRSPTHSRHRRARVICANEKPDAILAMPLSTVVDQLCDPAGPAGFIRCHIGLEFKGDAWRFDYNDATPDEMGYNNFGPGEEAKVRQRFARYRVALGRPLPPG